MTFNERLSQAKKDNQKHSCERCGKYYAVKQVLSGFLCKVCIKELVK